jgi:hypothetical protein
MIDSFLSIPDAESLPLYRMVLKLACVLVHTKYKPSNTDKYWVCTSCVKNCLEYLKYITTQILPTRSVNTIRYLLRSGTVKSPVTSR